MTDGSLLRAHGIHGLNRTVEEPKMNEILTVSLEREESRIRKTVTTAVTSGGS